MVVSLGRNVSGGRRALCIAVNPTMRESERLRMTKEALEGFLDGA